MNRKQLRKTYFVFFKIMLLIAGVLSITNQVWTNLILVLVTFVLIYFPKFIKVKKTFPNKLDILVLVLIYTSIFFENILYGKAFHFWFTFIHYININIVFGVIGFSLIYFINRNNKNLNLSPFFLSIIIFCFSISMAAIVQALRHNLFYFFQVNIQAYNPSAALGFLSINIFTSLIIAALSYLYLELDEEDSYLKKFFSKNQISENNFTSKQKEVLKLIKQSESETLEFKETLRYNIYTKQFDDRITHAILKSITAFLNTKGGTLLVGINDEGKIQGLERDDLTNSDKFMLYFNNLFKKHIGNEFIPFISYNVIKIHKKEIFVVDCQESDKEVFIKQNNGDEEFYIRTGPASVQIQGSKLIDYVQRKFRRN